MITEMLKRTITAARMFSPASVTQAVGVTFNSGKNGNGMQRIYIQRYKQQALNVGVTGECGRACNIHRISLPRLSTYISPLHKRNARPPTIVTMDGGSRPPSPLIGDMAYGRGVNVHRANAASTPPPQLEYKYKYACRVGGRNTWYLLHPPQFAAPVRVTN
jgi:hypothetical protein